VDIFGNAVPVSSSTIGVTTSAAGISGHVYNDINHSGVFTNGDAGLSGVTLQLFTDPNGDGIRRTARWSRLSPRMPAVITNC